MADPVILEMSLDSERSCLPGKQCTLCLEYLPFDKFQSPPSLRGKMTARCTSCTVKYNKEVYHRRTKHLRAQNPLTSRNQMLKQKYGITHADYEAMLAGQNGCCAICFSTVPGGNRARYFHVDHCHATGMVRGLLCGACNIGLGGFRDNPSALRRAADYLARAALIECVDKT